MIVIRHLTGPLAESQPEQTFDDSCEQVTFGRAPGCDVLYPSDFAIVSRKHAALVLEPSGKWTFDTYGNSAFFKDSVPVQKGETISSGATITLARHGGPSFQIETMARRGDLPITLVQDPVRSPFRMAMRSHRLAIGAGALAVVALIGVAGTFGYFEYWRRHYRDIAAQIQVLKAQQASHAAQLFSKEMKEKIEKLPHLVVTRDSVGNERGVGTAWPIGTRQFATNAHVAAVHKSLGQGESMHVKAPGSDGRIFKVMRSPDIHPGYAEFSSFVENEPTTVTVFRGQEEKIEAAVAYDVALLTVDLEIEPALVLERASGKEMQAIRAGAPVAFAGYPMEHILGKNMQQVAATPQFQMGNITAITNFFLLPPTPEQRFLIHHNLPATGGASGSPIVAPSGKIVGILNAGNVFWIEKTRNQQAMRIPNAALINYAQSVELFEPLLAGRVDLAAERAYWQQQVSDVAGTNLDQVAARVLRELDVSEAAAVARSKSDGKLTDADRVDGAAAAAKHLKSYKVSLGANERRVFMVLSPAAASIDLHLLIDGKVVSGAQTGRYKSIICPSDAAREAEVVLSAPDATESIGYQFRDYSVPAGSGGGPKR